MLEQSSTAARDGGLKGSVSRTGGASGLCVILCAMTNALKKAVAEVERLPEADQEQIGRQVINHVQKLRALRADIDAGIRSLDGGKGQELDIEDVIEVARHKHGGRR